MSQDIRKKPRGAAQFTDTTGISPQPRNDDQKNARRAQQITHLHQQFEDLKKKIREVENKNQKIIQKIHRAYNFKKKNAYTEQLMADTSPVIHFDNRMEVYSGANISMESKSDHNSEQQFKLQKRVSQMPINRKTNISDKFNYSVEYNKNEGLLAEDSDTGSINNLYGHPHYYPSTQMPPKLPLQKNISGTMKNNQKTKAYDRQSNQIYDKEKSQYSQNSQYSQHSQHSQKLSQRNLQIQQQAYQQQQQSLQQLKQPQQQYNINQRRQYQQTIALLQQQLNQKQTQLYRLSALQQKYKNYSKNVHMIIQNNLEEFFENGIMNKMGHIQKVYKKLEYKLKNLKRASIQAKDRQEAKVSNRLIEEGRRIRENNSRSKSRSRIQSSSPSQSNDKDRSYLHNQKQKVDLSNSRILSKRSGFEKEQSKQFQEIANKYQELIKIKNEQLQRLESKYKTKQRQCYQLKMRVDLLQKKLQEEEEKRTCLENSMTDNNGAKLSVGSFGGTGGIDTYLLKKASLDSNLLENLGQSDNNNKELQQFLQQQIQTLTTELANEKSKTKSFDDKLKQIHEEYNITLQKSNKKHSVQLQQLEQQLHIKNTDKIQILEKQTARINTLNQEQKQLLNAKEKIIMEKDCEIFRLGNKNKKLEATIEGKEAKIGELEKLIMVEQATSSHNISLDQSSLLRQSRKSIHEHTPQSSLIKQLKQEIDILEQQLETNKNQVFTLSKTKDYYQKKYQELENENKAIKKQIQLLQLENQELKNNINNISAVESAKSNFEKDKDKDKQKQNKEEEQQQESNLYKQSKLKQVQQQKQQWFNKYQQAKNSLLEKDSKIIKLNTQQLYTKKTLISLQQKHEKLKKQIQTLKKQNKEIKKQLSDKQNQLELQKTENQRKILQLQRQWIEFEEQVKKNQEGDISDRKSEISMYSTYSKFGNNKVEHLQTTNQLLTVKLKEAEAEIQAQKIMEERFLSQYRTNIQQSKAALKQKNEQIKKNQQSNIDLQNTIDKLTLQISSLQQQLSFNNTNSSNTNNNSNQIKKYTQLIDRIEQLEHQLKQTNQINIKLTDMEGQLFEEIKIKEEQRLELYDTIKSHENKIKELEEMLDNVNILKKEDNPRHNFSSHISTGSHQRESMKSQSSLKYSAYSHNYSKMLQRSNQKNSNNVNASNANNSGDQRIIDLELSEAGSQFFDVDQNQNNPMTQSSEYIYMEQPSYISNISQLFMRESQLPAQKMQKINRIKRSDQLKLFQKTSSYIKSLKSAITEKDKRIKLLQKKIESLRSSELVRQELGYLPDNPNLENLITSHHYDTGNQIVGDTFKDYESVQLDYRRTGGSSLRRYKQLEHDMKLVMEENNMLVHQIETLEQELLKAEEQENSLVKIKDLYKQEIKKLIKKNEEQTKAFEEDIRIEKQRVEQSESVHNMQAIKQLFIKIIQTVSSKFVEDGGNSKKKQQKRKQIEEYVKVLSNILRIDKKTKQSLLAMLHQAR